MRPIHPANRRPPAGLAPLLVLGVCLAPPSVRAIQYETEIQIESEEDLYDLAAQELITEDELETLLELYRAGVDLNAANREELYALPGLTYAQVDAILEYRRLAGTIDDPAALVRAGAISPGDLLTIAPFLVVGAPGSALPVSGRAELQTRYTLEDPVGPPLLFRTRMKLPRDVSLGLALTTTRFRLGPVGYDVGRGTLVAGAPTYGLYVPKFFLQWKSTGRNVVAGTFRLGFGERLTLDNTRRQTSNGVYPDDVVQPESDPSTFCRYSTTGGAEAVCDELGLDDLYSTPDYRWQDGFRGVAGSVTGLDLANGTTVDLHAFGSYQTRSIYQYDVFDRDDCVDPADPDCSAPPVFESVSDATRRFAFVTLPDVYDELAGGAHAELTFAGRTRVGITGYAASPMWRVGGMALDFQETSPYPWGGPFGAVGINGATRVGPVHLFIEGARSFDSTPGGGGGFGVVQRSVWGEKKREIELSLRYLDADFANPYGRPISAPDEHLGNRGRNEAGVRLRYTDRPTPDWRVRAEADVWTLPSDTTRLEGTAGTTNVDLLGRVDFEGWRFLKLMGWIEHVNKDLAENGFGDCYDRIATPTGETLAPAGYCRGELYRMGGRVRVQPFRDLVYASVQYSHELLDDPRYPDHFRQDAVVWLEVGARPMESLGMRVKTRYFIEDLEDDTYLERSSWTWGEVSWMPSRLLTLRLRYDLYAYLDERQSTQLRRPNPEHRLRLEFESRF